LKEDRPYQAEAVRKVLEHWQSGQRAVCLVAPTGAGKTHMAVRAGLAPGGTLLWSAHRTELVSQGFAALHAEIGGMAMGVIAPGHRFERDARVQVSSTQTLIRRGKPEVNPSVIVLDECHHYVADEFRQLTEWWPEARILGPTATPQRGDGKPLGDLFSRLVVAAQYSDLIEAGYLCDAVVYQPPQALEGGLANDPVETWKKYARGMSGFAFMPSIKAARELAEEFTEAGLPAACIDAKTPKAERAGILARFAAGELKVITNVDTMTEGVDVPAAGVCMLGRGFKAVGPYLQAAGRVLRPHASKEYAVIIDLTGCSIIHCPPTIERAYSLDGDGIRKGEGAENPVRNCPRCGKVYLCSLDACDECGAPKPLRVKRPPRIFDIELEEVWAGERTDEDAKAKEYRRLRAVQKEKGLSLYFVIKAYRELFGSAPKLFDVTPAEKKDVFMRLLKVAGPAAASARFRKMFGHYPVGKALGIPARS
jgi:DNA repair protein RadD